MKRVSGRELPFALEAVGGRYAAIDPSSSRRNQLWKPDHPYVTAIDGVPVERWVAAAAALLPRSHPLAVRARAANLLRFAGYFRTRLGLEDRPTFAVDLESADGRPLSVAVDDSGTARESLFKYNLFLNKQAPWRLTEARLGYLRLKGAPDKLAARLAEAMPGLRDSRGLVLDLRGNEGGGAGETLNLLGAWLAGGETPRHVAGFDRRRAGEPASSNFFVVDGDSPELLPDGRRLVGRALDRVRGRPTFRPPFATTDRCVLLAPPSVEPRIRPYTLPGFARLFPAEAVYHYDRPVVVLVDRHCFSSAELVAAGLQGLPNVTVVGERTRGGAGSPTRFRLPASGLDVSVTSRVLFVPASGVPIDGYGVVPDVQVELDLQTITGPGDPMLERAFREIEAALAHRGCPGDRLPPPAPR